MEVKLEKFRELREKAGYSKADLARIFKVDFASVARWEYGEALPKAKRLPELADLFGCTIDELYGRQPPDVPGGEG